MKKYKNANSAFVHTFNHIMKYGEYDSVNDTKYVTNLLFCLENPLDNIINVKWRKWSYDYAIMEWDWYLSGNPNADEIAKVAKIWKKCQDKDGNVNSNYGYQWMRGDQIGYVINELKNNPRSRRAVISIYDGKENELYKLDTPCTLAIHFYIENDKLDMSVIMRSNDLVYGFCNDQFQFSNLQKMIADNLGIGVGKYYHFVSNMHIYSRHFSMGSK